MKKILLLMLVCLAAMPLVSQTKYRSQEFYKAVESGHRTNTGVPGPKYHNNYVEYKMNIGFDPDSHILEGEEDVTFHLKMGGARVGEIYLNLYRNVYSKGGVRTRNVDPSDVQDQGMEILDVQLLKGGSQSTPLKYNISNTKMQVTLPEYLDSGHSATLRIKWRSTIAASSHHRGGQYGDRSWFVPYFYPQVAVYDDIYGWDKTTHYINEEFLMEFASYDVSIRLGHNMCAWATGNLQNASQIFTKPVLANIQKASTSDAEVTVMDGKDMGRVLQRQENVWRFKADSVPDFVFACSNDMGWVMSSAKLQPGKPRTLMSAVYHSSGFSRVVGYTRKTLDYLSNQRPGVWYPYQHMTIFEGSGGMEFPMMVNEDFDNSYDSDFFTTSHEVTHSYFPFITGMYQNRFGFLDEGLTQYVPQYFQNDNFESRNIITDASFYTRYVSRMEGNVPVFTQSSQYTDRLIFTVNSYYKPQIAYTVLEDIVGAQVMTDFLRRFVNTWRGRHPHPIDFFNLLADVSGKDISGCVRSWFFSNDYPDLSVSIKDSRTLEIRNVGGLYLPIVAQVAYADGSFGNIRRSALEWDDKSTLVLTLPKDISSVTIGDKWIPDADNGNNYDYK